MYYMKPIMVLTANHEFFGIGIVEAVAAGAYPLVPNHLSYPEILDLGQIEGAEQLFYNGTANDLAAKLNRIVTRIDDEVLWPTSISPSVLTNHLRWTNLAPQYDKALEQIRQSVG